MSLQVFVAHSGDCLQLDTLDQPLTNLDQIRAYLQDVTQIAVPDQVLLTIKGRQVRAQGPLTDAALFLYDRALFSKQQDRAAYDVNTTREGAKPSVFPSELTDQTSLRAWQQLFGKRRTWANTSLQQCRDLSQEAERAYEQREVILQAGQIATINLNNRIKTLEQKVVSAKEWSLSLTQEIDVHQSVLTENLNRLDRIHGTSQLLSLLDHGNGPRQSNDSNTTGAIKPLSSFLGRSGIESAATVSRDAILTVESDVGRVDSTLAQILDKSKNLAEAVQTEVQPASQSYMEEPSRLQHEIEVTVNKIATDCERIATMKSADSKALASASKVALLHTRSFLPSIRDYQLEMNDLLTDAQRKKSAAVTHLMDALQSVATIEADIGTANKDVADIQLTEEAQVAIEKVSLIAKLPLIYGLTLVEAVRRLEWSQKLKQDSSGLAEELANYRDEEQKRRRKWLKENPYIQSNIEADATLGVDISLRGQENSWADVTRADIHAFLQQCNDVQGVDEVVQEITVQLKSLDKPTVQQIKKAKAFRNGSIHEAGFGRASLLLRGDNESRILKEANAKLEEELKSSKSRIRRLEDVVHRQSQTPRMPSFGDPFAQQSQSGLAPGSFDVLASASPTQPIRPLSALPRRLSSNNSVHSDAKLRERIEQLTAELGAERRTKASLLDSMNKANDDTQRQISEINSTKQDLMENMEAQQKEFAQERRSLEDELEKYKAKLEEAEDELDRIVGSRENEKLGANTRLQTLKSELDQTQKSSRTQHQALREELRTHQDAVQGHMSKLSSIHNVLSPSTDAAEDTTVLLDSLARAAQDSVAKGERLTNDLSTLREQYERANEATSKTEAEATRLRTQAESSAQELLHAEQQLQSEQQAVQSLTVQLDSSKSLLDELQAKFADGDAGSESLKAQLAETGAKLNTLSMEIVESKSRVAEKEHKVASLELTCSELRSTIKSQHLRLQARGQHLSFSASKFAEHIDRLRKLLDSQGFLITTNSEGHMVVQRASKTSASSIQTTDDLPAIVTRRASLPLDDGQTTHQLDKLTSLLSSSGGSVDEEKLKFQSLMETLAWFNLDTFCESVAKRMRDIEYTARKWQKEARNYRDKAHRYHSDGAEKIAYRTFKEGDLALFLPTRNQVTRPWAAFNVGAPHFFLREQESHRLGSKEWLVARITKVQERVVKVNKLGNGAASSPSKSKDGEVAIEDDNPFELSDGLRWYLLDACEEKPGAPSTPGLGKAVVAAANVDARGSIRMSKPRPGQAAEEVNRQLSKSLESRRSSNASKKSAQAALAGLGLGKAIGGGEGEFLQPSSRASSVHPRPALASPDAEGAPAKTPASGEARNDLLWGP